MKILITYSSKTGNTKKVAEAIATVVEGADILDIKENPNFDDYDAVIVGYWADRGKADPLADKFLPNIKDKVCGVFATLGAYPDSDHAKDIINYGKNLLEENGNKVISTFICQGKIDPALTERFKDLPKDHPHYMDEARRKRHEEAAKHPDEKDLENAKTAFKDFVKELGA
ncbi:MAG: flavodoxin family protein [Tissierellia bacterium]|nr:flavodoxin family protein [Tissierellia bacterium]